MPCAKFVLQCVLTTACLMRAVPCWGQSGVLEDDNFLVECLRKIEVAAQADGLIAEMLVEEGDSVPADGVLFRIDNRVANAQLEVAKQELEAAIMQAKQDADVRFAKSTYAVAQAEAEAEIKLLQRGASNETMVRRKNLERDKTKLQIEVAEVKRQTDQVAVNVAEAKKSSAMVQLSLYDIQAPWDAVVIERLKDQGAWIRAGEPVLTIQHMYEMRVVGYIALRTLDEKGMSVASLEGAPIRIAVKISPTHKHVVDSQVEFVSGAIDTSARIKIWTRIKNQQVGDSWLLRSGMPAQVTISAR
ncbi:MAG: HlyD family efflux transporter periplasmic adaptor subunit [Pirellulaceae bacterium]|nr:HlyD family efflux transporter periplasmic adaptor subunit [Pirellulaceae bacterium]